MCWLVNCECPTADSMWFGQADEKEDKKAAAGSSKKPKKK